MRCIVSARAGLTTRSPCFFGRAVGIEVDRPRRGLVAERLDDAEPDGEARRYGEAIARHRDRRLEQLAPTAACRVPCAPVSSSATAPGHADRQARGDGLAERQRLAVGVEEHGGRGTRRRGLAAVIDGDRRASQRRNRAGSRRRRCPRPAARPRPASSAPRPPHRSPSRRAQHVEPRLDRQRMGGGDHLARFGLRRAGAEQRDSRRAATQPASCATGDDEQAAEGKQRDAVGARRIGLGDQLGIGRRRTACARARRAPAR